jgi:hypothetical protein
MQNTMGGGWGKWKYDFASLSEYDFAFLSEYDFDFLSVCPCFVALSKYALAGTVQSKNWMRTAGSNFSRGLLSSPHSLIADMNSQLSTSVGSACASKNDRDQKG